MPKDILQNMDNEVEFIGVFRPPKRSTKETIKLFLYNSEAGTVLGRTGSSWAKIGIFYLIFYGVLAALFAICLWVFFQTLDPRIPTCKLRGSLIGTSPGLGFRPMPPVDNVESTLIWYKGTDLVQYQHWTRSLEKFLEVYRKPGLTPGRGQNIYNCDYDRPPNENQVCDVDVKDWFPCTQENNFNYHKSAPCVFIKLNKIYDWRPEFYNETNDLPEKMPRHLKEYIYTQARVDSRMAGSESTKPTNATLEIFKITPKSSGHIQLLNKELFCKDLFSGLLVFGTLIGKPTKVLVLADRISPSSHKFQLNTIWISCEGENPADVENIGPIQYIPGPGFPGYFYPYKNSEGYLSPVMAVHFQRPRTGILINIECKAWARNIVHDRQERVGMVHFEMMID